MNQPLPVDGNLTATVHSVESSRVNSSAIVITIATNSTFILCTKSTLCYTIVNVEVIGHDEGEFYLSIHTILYIHLDGCPELPDSSCSNVGPVTWAETEIGQVASVPCPCGVSDPLIQLLRGTQRCGGTYEFGGMWEEPQCDSCQFSSTRLALCRLAEVGGLSGGPGAYRWI